MKIKQTSDMTVHSESDFVAYTIPADGFHKLVGYECDRGSWVHVDYRVKQKRKKRK